ncbi:MAG: glycosyltransferase [Bacteroidota bacterium]
MPKPHILILIDWFLPGYKAGGPIQSVRNLTLAMKEHFRFSILTTNTDEGSDEPYEGVVTNQWIAFDEHTDIYYCSHDQLSRQTIHDQIEARNPDYLYINSLFSLPFTIWPLQYVRGKKGNPQAVLAVRGMLHKGAISIKRWKKLAFIQSLKFTAVHKQLIWQATDEQELKDIKAFFGSSMKVRLSSNFPRQHQEKWQSLDKRPGEAKLVFHSRVSPKKNLDFLLPFLKGKDGVSLDIIGPMEDKEYVAQLKSLIEVHQIKARFLGPIPPQELQKKLANYHVSCLPTKGENFGHAIFEALLAGKPVWISDQTPWRDLEAKKVGWDISLSDVQAWTTVLDKIWNMDQAAYDDWSKTAWEYAKGVKESKETRESSIRLFQPIDL